MRRPIFWLDLLFAAKSCPTLCHPIDCSPPGSSVHGILQARTLEWVAMLSSRGFSQPRDWTQVSCIGEQSHLEALTRFRWLKKKNVIFTELPATDSPSPEPFLGLPWCLVGAFLSIILKVVSPGSPENMGLLNGANSWPLEEKVKYIRKCL